MRIETTVPPLPARWFKHKPAGFDLQNAHVRNHRVQTAGWSTPAGVKNNQDIRLKAPHNLTWRISSSSQICQKFIQATNMLDRVDESR